MASIGSSATTAMTSSTSCAATKAHRGTIHRRVQPSSAPCALTFRVNHAYSVRHPLNGIHTASSWAPAGG